MGKLIDLVRRKSGTSSETPGEPDPLQARFAAFQRLLEENNAALAAMADLEEKRAGEFLFDRAYLETTVTALPENVRRLVEQLQVLSGNAYPRLLQSRAAVAGQVRETCHYQEGNYKTLRRFRLLKRVLTQFGVDDARVRLEWISASEGDRVQHVITEMTGQLRALGPFNGARS